MDTIVATMEAKPGCADQVLEVLRGLVRDTSREPGAVDYQLHQGEAGRFVVYERYADEAAIDSHMKSEPLTRALAAIAGSLARPPEVWRCTRDSGMTPRTADLDGHPVEVHVIPIGPASLVFARGAAGVLGCGAIDPAPLQRLGIPAARVRPTRGASISGLDDLLAGEVREANEGAASRGVKPGMSGREALLRLTARGEE